MAYVGILILTLIPVIYRLTTHVDDRIIPSINSAVPPSLTSMVVDVHNPTTEPLPTSPSINPQRLADESYVIGSLPAHSPLYTTGPREESSSASHVISDYQLPGGNVLRPITSEQVPRYAKNITMQVNSSVQVLQTYIC